MSTKMFFAPGGRWEAGDSLKILSRDMGTFSIIEYTILKTFIFGLVGICWAFPDLTPISQTRDHKMPTAWPNA